MTEHTARIEFTFTPKREIMRTARAVCSCGWQGEEYRVRRTIQSGVIVQMAESDRREHTARRFTA